MALWMVSAATWPLHAYNSSLLLVSICSPCFCCISLIWSGLILNTTLLVPCIEFLLCHLPCPLGFWWHQQPVPVDVCLSACFTTPTSADATWNQKKNWSKFACITFVLAHYFCIGHQYFCIQSHYICIQSGLIITKVIGSAEIGIQYTNTLGTLNTKVAIAYWVVVELAS
jgi:hypothetical protein